MFACCHPWLATPATDAATARRPELNRKNPQLSLVPTAPGCAAAWAHAGAYAYDNTQDAGHHCPRLHDFRPVPGRRQHHFPPDGGHRRRPQPAGRLGRLSADRRGPAPAGRCGAGPRGRRPGHADQPPRPHCRPGSGRCHLPDHRPPLCHAAHGNRVL